MCNNNEVWLCAVICAYTQLFFSYGESERESVCLCVYGECKFIICHFVVVSKKSYRNIIYLHVYISIRTNDNNDADDDDTYITSKKKVEEMELKVVAKTSKPETDSFFFAHILLN